MAKFLVWFAMVVLAVTLPTTWAAVWFQWPSASNFVELTTALSWPVFAGGLVVGAREYLKTLLEQLVADRRSTPGQ